MRNERGDEAPFAYGEARRDRRQLPMRFGPQAADVDMQLVLRPHDARVDDEELSIACRRRAAGRLDKRARPPGLGEIVRSVGQNEKRILHALDSPGRNENRVVEHRRAKDHMAAFLPAREIDREAGKGRARRSRSSFRRPG